MAFLLPLRAHFVSSFWGCRMRKKKKNPSHQKAFFTKKTRKINLIPIDRTDDGVSKSYIREPEFLRYYGNVIIIFRKCRYNRTSQPMVR